MTARFRRPVDATSSKDKILDMEAARAKYEGRYPEELIDRALEITQRRMDLPFRQEIRNPKAFFQSVLRQLVLAEKVKRGRKGRGTAYSRARSELIQRIAINSLVGDLKAAGFSRAEIYHKVLESFSGKVSPELLDEFRRTLVGREESVTRKAS